MNPILVDGEITRPLLTEAEVRAERAKREADQATLDNTLAYGDFLCRMVDDIFKGAK